MTTKNGPQNFLGKGEPRENPNYAYKKRARFTFVWGPRMVNPTLSAE